MSDVPAFQRQKVPRMYANQRNRQVFPQDWESYDTLDVASDRYAGCTGYCIPSSAEAPCSAKCFPSTLQLTFKAVYFYSTDQAVSTSQVHGHACFKTHGESSTS